MPEWFEEWFGEEYLELYPHRDDADADRAVGLVLGAVEFAAGWRVLDVACGRAGTHAPSTPRVPGVSALTSPPASCGLPGA